MAQVVTLRFSNTDDVSTASSISFEVLSCNGDLVPVGDVAEKLGGTKANRRGGRYMYEIVPWRFSLANASVNGDFLDHGDYLAIKNAVSLHAFLWLYSVSGGSRVALDHTSDFWASHCPVGIVLTGDPRSSVNYNGTQTVTFEFEGRSLVLS